MFYNNSKIEKQILMKKKVVLQMHSKSYSLLEKS